jgi:hypothetical protein
MRLTAVLLECRQAYTGCEHVSPTLLGTSACDQDTFLRWLAEGFWSAYTSHPASCGQIPRKPGYHSMAHGRLFYLTA